MHVEETKTLYCSTFQDLKPVIEEITDYINRSGKVEEKARFAEELKKEVNVLLSCLDYNRESSDCRDCHFIAHLRKKTANLLIRTSKLAK